MARQLLVEDLPELLALASRARLPVRAARRLAAPRWTIGSALGRAGRACARGRAGRARARAAAAGRRARGARRGGVPSRSPRALAPVRGMGVIYLCASHDAQSRALFGGRGLAPVAYAGRGAGGRPTPAFEGGAAAAPARGGGARTAARTAARATSRRGVLVARRRAALALAAGGCALGLWRRCPRRCG